MFIVEKQLYTNKIFALTNTLFFIKLYLQIKINLKIKSNKNIYNISDSIQWYKI